MCYGTSRRKKKLHVSLIVCDCVFLRKYQMIHLMSSLAQSEFSKPFKIITFDQLVVSDQPI